MGWSSCKAKIRKVNQISRTFSRKFCNLGSSRRWSSNRSRSTRGGHRLLRSRYDRSLGWRRSDSGCRSPCSHCLSKNRRSRTQVQRIIQRLCICVGLHLREHVTDILVLDSAGDVGVFGRENAHILDRRFIYPKVFTLRWRQISDVHSHAIHRRVRTSHRSRGCLTTQCQLGTGKHRAADHSKQTLFCVRFERIHPDNVGSWDVQPSGSYVVDDVVANTRSNFFYAFSGRRTSKAQTFLPKGRWDRRWFEKRFGAETKKSFRRQFCERRSVDTSHPPGTRQTALFCPFRAAGCPHGRCSSKNEAGSNGATASPDSKTKLSNSLANRLTGFRCKIFPSKRINLK